MTIKQQLPPGRVLGELDTTTYIELSAVVAVKDGKLSYYCAPEVWAVSEVHDSISRLKRIRQLEQELAQLKAQGKKPKKPAATPPPRTRGGDARRRPHLPPLPARLPRQAGLCTPRCRLREPASRGRYAACCGAERATCATRTSRERAAGLPVHGIDVDMQPVSPRYLCTVHQDAQPVYPVRQSGPQRRARAGRGGSVSR